MKKKTIIYGDCAVVPDDTEVEFLARKEEAAKNPPVYFTLHCEDEDLKEKLLKRLSFVFFDFLDQHTSEE